MTRRYPLLLLACLPLAAVSAPVPKETELTKLQRAYGIWSDPDKDCRLAFKDGELKVSLPAADHLFGVDRQGATNNAPRTLREVEGDFTAVVQVKYTVPEEGIRWANWRYRSGGLVAWESEKLYYVLRLCGSNVEGFKESLRGQHRSGDSWSTTVTNCGELKETAFLRLKREGQKLHTGYSRDGKAWKEFNDPAEVAWGKKVKVGIVAENCLGVECEITFDQYSLTQPKK